MLWPPLLFWGTAMKLPVLTAALFSLAAMSPCSVNATEKANFLGVFVGQSFFEDESDFTIGLEYERRLTPEWGIGAIYERAPSYHHGDGIDVAVASLYYHFEDHWRLGLGYGKEEVGGDHPHHEDFIRASVAYGIHYGNLEIEPTVDVDFISDDEVVVIGIAVLYAF